MTTRLRDRQDDERRETLGQMMVLDCHRVVRRSGCTFKDAAFAKVQAARELLVSAERDGEMAIAEGESFAEVARMLDISRQAAAKKYRHLRAV